MNIKVKAYLEDSHLSLDKTVHFGFCPYTYLLIEGLGVPQKNVYYQIWKSCDFLGIAANRLAESWTRQ